jgi:hypothetical protein
MNAIPIVNITIKEWFENRINRNLIC